MSLRNRMDCPKYHQIIPKKGAKSCVWQFFGLPGDENGKLVSDKVSICELCTCAVSSRATSNLWSHLKHHHIQQYHRLNPSPDINIVSVEGTTKIEVDEEHYRLVEDESFRQMIKTFIPSSDMNIVPAEEESETEGDEEFTGSFSSQTDTSAQSTGVGLKKITENRFLDYAPLDDEEAMTFAVTKFIACSMQPYELVDDESFRQMIKTLNPGYNMPGRKYFSNDAIPKLYLQGVEKLKDIFHRSNTHHVSITCDCWTSVAGQPYLAVTIHFIDDNWKLISACLSCSYFEEDHNAENLKNVIQSKLEEWGFISQTIVSCTTDNGANIVNAVQLLNVSHIPCFAHSITIGVNNCIEISRIKRAVGRLKSLQNSVAHSWKMKKNLIAAQQLLQCEEKNLPSACPTRWWSTLKLCKRFLDNQLPLRKMLQDFPTQKSLMPEGVEVTPLEKFIEIVSVLEDITNNLTGENFVTASLILPLIRKIKKSMRQNNEDGALTKTLKEMVLNSLKEYEEEPLLQLLQKSTFLDPRFRLSFFDDDIKENVLTIVKDELKAFPVEVKTEATQLECPPKKKKIGLAALLEDEENSDSISSDFDKSAQEIEKYLSIPKIGLDDNPLLWWRQFSLSYPGLSKLAKKYLCVQGSRVPSERVFSNRGNMINKQICTLSAKNAEMQIFLSYNKKILGL